MFDRLQSFGRELAAGPFELPVVLSLLTAQIEAVAHSAPVFVFLYDPTQRRFTLRRLGGSAQADELDLSFDREGSLAHSLAAAERPVCLLDPEGESLLAGLATEERQALESLGLVLFLPFGSRSRHNEAGEALEGWLALGPHPSGETYGANEVSYMAALADVTALALEVLRLEERVQEAEQDKAEFIDFAAHELKQPMTSVQGYAKMLTMGIGGELNDTQREFVEVINANADRMGKLVNDLLEISRLEAGRIKLKLTPVQLGEVVAETLATTRSAIEARHHTLEVDIPEHLPPVLGDRERLIQLLTNLVSNAYRYTPDGGTIQITVCVRDHGQMPSGHLRVSVSDTGIGLSPEDLFNLNEKFFRADHDLVQRQPGTGLGLAIVRHLVVLHGSELTVESQVDSGSTFSFTLPIADMRED